MPIIIDLIDRLRRDLGDAFFALVDYWDGDLLAQGLGRPDDPYTVVYVLLATAHVSDELVPQEGLYCYACEVPSLDPDGVADTIEAADNVSYETLRSVIARHLTRRSHGD
jgi:hypothetical protein